MYLNPKEVKTGTIREQEHISTYRYFRDYVEKHHKMPPKLIFFKRIAEDHIKEDPRYYTKYKMR